MPLPSDITSAPARVVVDELHDGAHCGWFGGDIQRRQMATGALVRFIELGERLLANHESTRKGSRTERAANALREFKLMDAERSNKTSEQSTSDDSLIPKNYHITVRAPASDRKTEIPDTISPRA